MSRDFSYKFGFVLKLKLEPGESIRYLFMRIFSVKCIVTVFWYAISAGNGMPPPKKY